MTKRGVPQPLNLEHPETRAQVLALLDALRALPEGTGDIAALLRAYPSPTGTYAKSQLLGAYRALVERGAYPDDQALELRLRGRPVRTVSGVAPVAVLTAPYACPGECLFCPHQDAAPKSYLDGEPGVLRAIQYGYDPFAQTAGRIESLAALGHATDKIELLILGGTWSYYPVEYQDWFLRRCFDALNGSESPTLAEALRRNETALHRNVGLVIETRPDWVTPEEIARLRRQGVTKVQLGVQSNADRILALNKRGHTTSDTHRAIRRLRLAGFKIVAHWMPNLYGATLESDLADFARFWDDPALHPDELKIYPCALLEGTELHTLWQAGQYTPYAEEMLIELLVQVKQLIPPYVRVNRLMRDIPADYIVAGTTKSNLRQVVQQRMAERGLICQCIRCREVREVATRQPQAASNTQQVRLEDVVYETNATEEHFLQFLMDDDLSLPDSPTTKLATTRLVGFLRLSLPLASRDLAEIPIPEIREAAMIREVHVYGPAQLLGERERGVQHQGLGTQLLEAAARIAQQSGFRELAVIAAVGTREYYRERGFARGELYLLRNL